jgi:hypothetical protein
VFNQSKKLGYGVKFILDETKRKVIIKVLSQLQIQLRHKLIIFSGIFLKENFKANWLLMKKHCTPYWNFFSYFFLFNWGRDIIRKTTKRSNRNTKIK